MPNSLKKAAARSQLKRGRMVESKWKRNPATAVQDNNREEVGGGGEKGYGVIKVVK